MEKVKKAYKLFHDYKFNENLYSGSLYEYVEKHMAPFYMGETAGHPLLVSLIIQYNNIDRYLSIHTLK